MDGIHDLGGRQGFGAVGHERDEPVFHAKWEARVHAIMFGARESGAYRNIDQFRHAIERIDPRAYLTHGYYGRWLGGLENLLVESGAMTQRQIAEAVAARGGRLDDLVAARPSPAPDVLPEATSGPMLREVAEPPRFAVGDAVTTRAAGISGHTRLPAYARGKRAEVLMHHGAWVFPDTHAHGRGEQPAHLYTVEFTAAELWGEEAEPHASVTLDLFEPYFV